MAAGAPRPMELQTTPPISIPICDVADLVFNPTTKVVLFGASNFSHAVALERWRHHRNAAPTPVTATTERACAQTLKVALRSAHEDRSYNLQNANPPPERFALDSDTVNHWRASVDATNISLESLDLTLPDNPQTLVFWFDFPCGDFARSVGAYLRSAANVLRAGSHVLVGIVNNHGGGMGIRNVDRFALNLVLTQDGHMQDAYNYFDFIGGDSCIMKRMMYCGYVYEHTTPILGWPRESRVHDRIKNALVVLHFQRNQTPVPGDIPDKGRGEEAIEVEEDMHADGGVAARRSRAKGQLLAIEDEEHYASNDDEPPHDESAPRQALMLLQEYNGDGFVYIMRDRPNRFKVGASRHPRLRLRQLKTANVDITFLYATRVRRYLDAEASAHFLLKQRDGVNHVGGEWFEGEEGLIRGIVNESVEKFLTV